MPRRKLTVDEQAFVNYWTERMLYFKMTVRRADLYIRDIPREIYTAAYKEVSNSGFVAGGEWDKPLPKDKTRWKSWEPKQQDRETYVNYMRDVINRHPLTSPLNAKGYKDTKPKHRDDINSSPPLPIQRDHDEPPIDQPFLRSRPMPKNPMKKISLQDWKQLEIIGETFFVEDEDDTTGFTAFELASIVYVKAGKYYKVRYEGYVDSIRIEERELFAMIKDGIWV